MTLLNTFQINGTLPVSDTTEPSPESLNAQHSTASPNATLRDSVEQALHNYFNHLDGQDVTDVYNMVLSEVEAPLLESVMDYVKGNQTRASEVLGLNRGTLRKKLKQYGLL
ncbi:MAG: DNA-binding transcriptional regulator Fis [Gammaproteobacteria bacterium]|nr:DNA-binding transcriptional regulator Fis [Gammaproteobacteria bacterium]